MEKKRVWFWSIFFVSLLCLNISLLIFNTVILRSKSYSPLEIPLEGKVVILDENGEEIPFRPTDVKVFSHYDPSVFMNRRGRNTWNLHIDESGNFRSRIPEYAITLYCSTGDGKHAAVVDIIPGELLTELIIELRPRYSVTGRLLGNAGTPLANQEFCLECYRRSDFTDAPLGQRHAINEVFHSIEAVTDSGGFFTLDGFIPGTKYDIVIFRADKSGYRATSLETPILQPEQYLQPFSFGDVIVPLGPPSNRINK